MAKIDEVAYDAMMHASADDEGLSMAAVDLPAPMLGLAISARTRGDEQKLGDSLSKLVAEDPCLAIEHNAIFNETVIRGLGDLHLRMVLEKMKDRFNVEVDTRPPKIAYRETIRKPAEGHHRHKKQTGGAGQFGEVYLKIEPMERGAGFEFVDAVVGGVIPNQFIPAVEKGVRQVLATGAVAGYPIHDVRVTVYDGKHHSVDSKEVAFVAAGKKAFVDAVGKAAPIVLEPIVDIQVTVPQANMGDIAGDLSSKRGRINGTEAMTAGMVMVSGQAPLAELGSYQSEAEVGDRRHGLLQHGAEPLRPGADQPSSSSSWPSTGRPRTRTERERAEPLASGPGAAPTRDSAQRAEPKARAAGTTPDPGRRSRTEVSGIRLQARESGSASSVAGAKISPIREADPCATPHSPAVSTSNPPASGTSTTWPGSGGRPART